MMVATMAPPRARPRLPGSVGCRLLHPRSLRRRQSRGAAVPPSRHPPASRRGALDRGADRASALVETLGVLGAQHGADTSRSCALDRAPRQVSAALPRRPRADAARRTGRGGSLPGQGVLHSRATGAYLRAQRAPRSTPATWIYEVDPLVCRECGADMRILAFILDPPVIRKILHHLGKKRSLPARAPPNTRVTAIS